MKDKPLIGILGGMGTAAGIYFQQLFFNIYKAKGANGDQDYPEWIYFNASKAPDRTNALLNNGASPAPYLIETIKKMEAAGADIIIVICNTAHSFYNTIFEQTSIPWISLQKETASYIQNKGYSSASLLSTEGTLLSGVFREVIKPLGINYIEPQPDSDMQKKITSSIYNPHFGIKFTGSKISSDAVKLIQEVVDDLETEAIIAGCTELSLLDDYLKLKCDWLDPLKIAAETCFKITYKY